MHARRYELLLLFLAALALNWVGTMWWLSDGSLHTASASGVAQVAPQAVEDVQAAAAIPRTFSYQGTLRNASGNPINGNVKITLKIYNVVSGGSALYTEVFDPVVARNGVFSIVVGDAAGSTIPANLFDNERLFLGIAVGTDAELTPRQRLHPVPWAMQASTAQTAVTANNLPQGGGVPNIVRFGTGGAKEIAFVDGGKITDAPAGMTFTSPALALTGNVAVGGSLTVGGDLAVTGSWSAGAILDKGDSNGGANQRSAYPVSINRYVVEAPDNGASPDTVPVDNALLTLLCQDEDGCKVNLYMRDWDPARKPGLLAGISSPYRLSLAAPATGGQRDWDLRDSGANFSGGVDANGVINHGINSFNACFFTDGEYINAQGSDTTPGFGLLNWVGAYDSVNMTCVLIIED